MKFPHPIHSFQDVLDFYGEFILGHVHGVPNFESPLNSSHATRDTLSLYQLNRRGILTVNGQVGVCESRMRQRAYLDFYVPYPSRLYSKLCEGLSRSRDLLFIATLPNGRSHGTMIPVTSKFPMMDGIETRRPLANTMLVRGSLGRSLPVTLQKTPDATWEAVTNFWLDFYRPDQAFFDWNIILKAMTPASRAKMPQVASFAIIHRRFCENNLIPILLRYIQ